MASCCGQRVPATAEAVQALLTARGLTASEQALEWLAAGRSWPDPDWMRTCLDHAHQMAQMVDEERQVMALLGDSAQLPHTTQTASRRPTELAERRFEWLGERRGVTTGVLRDGIARLAGMGYISPDIE